MEYDSAIYEVKKGSGLWLQLKQELRGATHDCKVEDIQIWFGISAPEDKGDFHHLPDTESLVFTQLDHD